MIYLVPFLTRFKGNERPGRYHTPSRVVSFTNLPEYKDKTMSATIDIYGEYFHYKMLLYYLVCSNISSIQTLTWRFCYKFFREIFVNFTHNC